MPSIAVSAQGTLCQIRTSTGPTVYTTVKGVTSYSGLDGQRTENDVTDFESLAHEMRLGLKNNGSFQLQGWRNDTDVGQAKVLSELNNTVSTPWKIVLNNGHFYSFNAFVKSFSIAGGVDASTAMTISLTVDGDYTFT
jgi:hypothetical protein